MREVRVEPREDARPDIACPQREAQREVAAHELGRQGACRLAAGLLGIRHLQRGSLVRGLHLSPGVERPGDRQARQPEVLLLERRLEGRQQRGRQAMEAVDDVPDRVEIENHIVVQVRRLGVKFHARPVETLRRRPLLVALRDVFVGSASRLVGREHPRARVREGKSRLVPGGGSAHAGSVASRQTSTAKGTERLIGVLVDRPRIRDPSRNRERRSARIHCLRKAGQSVILVPAAIQSSNARQPERSAVTTPERFSTTAESWVRPSAIASPRTGTASPSSAPLTSSSTVPGSGRRLSTRIICRSSRR